MNVPALDVVHAGFIRRFAAFIIDGFIIGIAFYAAALVLVVVVVLLAPGLGDASDETVGLAAVLGYLLLMAFYYVGAGCYYALQESSRHQATVGKRAMGIKVTDDDGNRLSRTHAFGRWFAAVLSYLSFYIGFLMAGFTERKRALHDMVADTLVVDRWAFTDTPERQQRGAGAAVILVLIVGFFIVVGVLGILAAIAIPAYRTTPFGHGFPNRSTLQRRSSLPWPNTTRATANARSTERAASLQPRTMPGHPRNPSTPGPWATAISAASRSPFPRSARIPPGSGSGWNSTRARAPGPARPRLRTGTCRPGAGAETPRDGRHAAGYAFPLDRSPPERIPIYKE